MKYSLRMCVCVYVFSTASNPNKQSTALKQQQRVFCCCCYFLLVVFGLYDIHINSSTAIEWRSNVVCDSFKILDPLNEKQNEKNELH